MPKLLAIPCAMELSIETLNTLGTHYLPHFPSA